MKALAEIYIIHSFAPLGVEVEKKTETHRGPQKTYHEEDGEKEARKQKLAETEEEPF